MQQARAVADAFRQDFAGINAEQGVSCGKLGVFKPFRRKGAGLIARAAVAQVFNVDIAHREFIAAAGVGGKITVGGPPLVIAQIEQWIGIVFSHQFIVSVLQGPSGVFKPAVVIRELKHAAQIMIKVFLLLIRVVHQDGVIRRQGIRKFGHALHEGLDGGCLGHHGFQPCGGYDCPGALHFLQPEFKIIAHRVQMIVRMTVRGHAHVLHQMQYLAQQVVPAVVSVQFVFGESGFRPGPMVQRALHRRVLHAGIAGIGRDVGQSRARVRIVKMPVGALTKVP